MTAPVDAAFPTGNGLVEVRGSCLTVQPDLRDSQGDRWYWHIRVRPRSGIRWLRVAHIGALARFGPAFSRRGAHYRWLSRTSLAPGMRPVHLGSVVEAGGYLAATLPYGPAQLARCLAHCARRGARVCWLPNGVGSPSLPVVRYGASEPRALLVVVGRLHACEATASYVIEGLVARFMARSRSSNAPTALVCVPFVDLPGVIAGDQGKGRRPHDHNRDFGTTSRHPETIAVRELVESLQGPIIAVDVHTPGLVGKLEERPYLVTSGDRRERQAAQAAVSWLDAELPSNGEQPGLLVFDETWNTGEAATLRSFAGWMRSRPNTWLALTFEYPNAVDRGSPVTPSTARRTGACLADWLHTVLADVAQPGICAAPMLSLRPGSRA